MTQQQVHDRREGGEAPTLGALHNNQDPGTVYNEASVNQAQKPWDGLDLPDPNNKGAHGESLRPGQHAENIPGNENPSRGGATGSWDNPSELSVAEHKYSQTAPPAERHEKAQAVQAPVAAVEYQVAGHDAAAVTAPPAEPHEKTQAVQAPVAAVEYQVAGHDAAVVTAPPAEHHEASITLSGLHRGIYLNDPKFQEFRTKNGANANATGLEGEIALLQYTGYLANHPEHIDELNKIADSKHLDHVKILKSGDSGA